MIRPIHFPAWSMLIVAGMTIFLPAVRAADKDFVEPGINVQARGPVHEAFAQPTTIGPEPGPLVPKAPPDPIAEEPPDQKPDSPNLQWIPGYWSWDGEKKDWLWVSGFWRTPPPTRRWVPGHWMKTDDGWRWISGLWAPASSGDLDYLERPPQSLEVGPAVPATDDESIYVPGLWVYRSARFLWRPGYWMAGRPDWVWCAAHYLWTPRGFIYVDGYWDYPLEDRGCLFAPVFFDRPLWAAPGWCYRPSVVVNVGSLFSSLWVYPSGCCYCFGDYYDPFYDRLGFQAWFAFGARHHDPLFGYYGWRHRSDPGWAAGLRSDFAARSRGELARPPVTFAAQAASANAGSGAGLVTPLVQLKSVGKTKLTTVNPAQLAEHRQSVKQLRELAVQRGTTEKAKPTVSPLSRSTGAPQDFSPKLEGSPRPSSRTSDQSPAAGGAPPAVPSNPLHFPGEDSAPRILKGTSPAPAPAISRTAPLITGPSISPVMTRSAPVFSPPARSTPPPPSSGHGGFNGGGGHDGGSGGHNPGHGGGHSDKK